MTPYDLMSAARCFRCIPSGMTRSVWSYLIYQWALRNLCETCDVVSSNATNSIVLSSASSVCLTASTLGDTHITDDSNLTLVYAPNCTTLMVLFPGVFYIARNQKLTRLLFPALVNAQLSNYQIDDNDALEILELPLVTSMGDIGVHDCARLAAFSAPVLSNVIGYVAIRRLPALTAIHLESLRIIHETCDFTNNTSLSSLDLRALEEVQGIGTFPALTCAGCTNLASVNLQSYLPSDSTALTFTGCALPSAQVNSILARCVASSGFVSGSVNLSGGTNGPPTGQGLSDKTTLTNRGVVVTVNP